MRFIGTLGIIGLLACDTTESSEKNVAPEILDLSVTPDTGIRRGSLERFARPSVSVPKDIGYVLGWTLLVVARVQ